MALTTYLLRSGTDPVYAPGMVRSRLFAGAAALLLACPAAASAAHAPLRAATHGPADPAPDTLSLLALGTAGLVVGRRMSRSHRRA